jgi:GT2 family glycosyltransferase
VNETPRVSAIIANWNGAHHLRICLPSLRSQNFKALEIIVVDNGSSDDSAEVTRQYSCRWLPLEKNVGLAPALNRGAEIAAGEMLLFVNNDMRFDAGFVDALVQALQRDNAIFATDAMQFNWDGTRRGHMAACLKKCSVLDRTPVGWVPGLRFYQQEQRGETPVFMGSAACMLMRRKLFKQIGGFDARLPLGYEDAEICCRAWLRGWKTIYVPQAICWHHIGASGRSPAAVRLNFRGVLTGRLLLASKLLPMRYAVLTWIAATAGLAVNMATLRFATAKDRLTILFEVSALLPQLLRERTVLFKDAGKSPEEHLQFLLRLTNEDAAC